jgi:hypothetical protein
MSSFRALVQLDGSAKIAVKKQIPVHQSLVSMVEYVQKLVTSNLRAPALMAGKVTIVVKR